MNIKRPELSRRGFISALTLIPAAVVFSACGRSVDPRAVPAGNVPNFNGKLPSSLLDHNGQELAGILAAAGCNYGYKTPDVMPEFFRTENGIMLIAQSGIKMPLSTALLQTYLLSRPDLAQKYAMIEEARKRTGSVSQLYYPLSSERIPLVTIEYDYRSGVGLRGAKITTAVADINPGTPLFTGTYLDERLNDGISGAAETTAVRVVVPTVTCPDRVLSPEEVAHAVHQSMYENTIASNFRNK